VRNDLLRDATKQQPGQAAMTAAADHDQIGLFALGYADDLLSWVAP